MNQSKITRRELLQASATVGCLAAVPFAQSVSNELVTPAAEYFRHFAALSKLSIAVADAMPANEYGFRPHPESMNFGELMAHIAATNYQFCAGLKDAEPPAAPSPTTKEGYVKFLSDSFEYCAAVISSATEPQLRTPHNSPDGRMLGRDVLLAMYVHVAHHRGQAEIYLRDKGIRPPSYMV